MPPSTVPSGTDLDRAHRDFVALARCVKALPLEARIEFVNFAINHLIDYAPDWPPGSDEWSTPCETIARGAGDCEDFAIAKFFLLLAGGAPPQAVRLVYAQRCLPAAPAVCSAHMVVAARWPFDDPWILDSINLLLVPASQRDDLAPVFSFDQEQIWPALDTRPVPAHRHLLRPWRDLLARQSLQIQAPLASLPEEQRALRRSQLSR